MLHNFTYLGVPYTMTDEEIDAGYYYRKHDYRLADAKSEFQYRFDANTERLKEEFNISYEDAISDEMLEEYVDYYEDHHDCDIDENTQWEFAIETVLKEKMEGLL